MNAARELTPLASPAQVYEGLFVPALFRHWGPVLCDLALVGPGQRVLDVACGTGALTRSAAERVGPRGSVIGVDKNPDMLRVARGLLSGVEWLEAPAEALPLSDQSVDAVVSQFGLMFFEDRLRGLREMLRVLRPEGRLAVAVWSALEPAQAYARLTSLIGELFGDSVASAFRAPFVLGDATILLGLAREAELADAGVVARAGTARFASLDDLLHAERVWLRTVGGPLDDEQFERLRQGAQGALAPFVAPDGSLAFAMPALILHGKKAT